MKMFRGYDENYNPIYADDSPTSDTMAVDYSGEDYGYTAPYANQNTQSVANQGRAGKFFTGALNTLGAIGQGAIGTGDFITKTFVPRTRKFVEDVGSMAVESVTNPKAAEYYKSQYGLNPFGTDQERGNIINALGGPVASLGASALTGGRLASPTLGMVAPAGGEIASYMLPATGFDKAGKLAKPLQRMGASAISGMAGGFVHGATSPEDLTPVDRAFEATKQSFMSGVTALAISGGLEGARIAVDKLRGLGSYFTRRIVTPEVRKGAMNFMDKEDRATEMLLEKTRGLTGEQIARDVSGQAKIYGDALEEAVSKSPIKYTQSSIQDNMVKQMRTQLPQSIMADPLSGQGVADVVVVMTDNADQLASGDYSMNAKQVLASKRAVGNMLDKLDAWNPDKVLTPNELVMKEAYFFLKDTLEQMAPDSSALSEGLEQLIQISRGAFKSTHRLTSGNVGKILTPSSIPILGLLPNLAEPVNMAIARGAYNVGSMGEKIIESPVISSAIRKLGGLATGAVGAMTNK